MSIVCYAYVPATLAARAFGGTAGLNRYGHAPSRLLNLLGWAPPLRVFADVAENVATWLIFTLVHNGWWWRAWPSRLGMALAAAAKIVGVAGVLLPIVGWRALRPRR